MKITNCKHCGRCCLSGLPCYFGQILFDITDTNPQPCPACITENELHWCGLLENPLKWFSPLVGEVLWKCEAMADIAKVYMGVGEGCGVSPNSREIFSKMQRYGKSGKV